MPQCSAAGTPGAVGTGSVLPPKFTMWAGRHLGEAPARNQAACFQLPHKGTMGNLPSGPHESPGHTWLVAPAANTRTQPSCRHQLPGSSATALRGRRWSSPRVTAVLEQRGSPMCHTSHSWGQVGSRSRARRGQPANQSEADQGSYLLLAWQ